MDTHKDTPSADTQTFRHFLDNGSIADTDTAYADGSHREPHWTPEAEPTRSLAPSPFAQAREIMDTLEADAAEEAERAAWERS